MEQIIHCVSFLLNLWQSACESQTPFILVPAFQHVLNIKFTNDFFIITFKA